MTVRLRGKLEHVLGIPVTGAALGVEVGVERIKVHWEMMLARQLLTRITSA